MSKFVGIKVSQPSKDVLNPVLRGYEHQLLSSKDSPRLKDAPYKFSTNDIFAPDATVAHSVKNGLPFMLANYTVQPSGFTNPEGRTTALRMPDLDYSKAYQSFYSVPYVSITMYLYENFISKP